MTAGKHTRNVVILFSVPQNTGDEALLEAMKLGLMRLESDISFSVSVKNKVSLPTAIQDYKIIYDPDEAIFYDDNPTKTYWLQRIRKILSRLGILHHVVRRAWWTTRYSRETMAAIDSADLILLSGGSYLNDIYDARPKLAAIVSIASRTAASIILTGQSVGPFWRDSSAKLFSEALSKMAVISLRESRSLRWIPEYLQHRVRILPDLAFLHYKNRKSISMTKKQGHQMHIGVCFRAWKNDHTNIEELGLAVVSRLLGQYGVRVTFISTCQGIKSYVDDHQMSAKITGRLDNGKATVTDHIHHSPESFMHACQSFDGVISMRLHGCILAMVSGTPAFCIGYEDKSEGIYEMIGYEKYHVHYTNIQAEMLKSIDNFMDAIPTISKELPDKMADMYEKATLNFEQLKSFVGNE